MSERRDRFIEEIIQERVKQFNLPGSEWDIENTPNDWIAIIVSCLSEEVRRFNRIGNSEDLEQAFIKSAAVMLAAFESIPTMKNRNHLL